MNHKKPQTSTFTSHEFDSIVEWEEYDVDCTVTFEYTPHEPTTIDCPGDCAIIDIVSVMINNYIKILPVIDIVDLMGSVQRDRLESACFKHIEEQNEEFI